MLATRHRADLCVRVPRGAAGDVEGGVRDVLESVDSVGRIESCDLRGVEPDALDLYVEARVTVAFEEAVEAPAERLRDGFGVVEVAVGAAVD